MAQEITEPRLGETSAEVFQAWVKLSQEDYSPHVIGARLGYYRYVFQVGKMLNLHLYPCRDGAILSLTSELSANQMNDLLDGFAQDNVHIELRHKTSSFGLWRSENSDALIKVLHKAKGRFRSNP